MASSSRGSKKGRSFLYKARKYGKKGLYGRGKNVDEDTYNYFVRVMERLKEDFEDEDEKELFVTNVFQQTVDKEMDLMCNQVISKVIEKLLGLAKPEILENYAGICLKEMRIVCTDPYASHVLEKLMNIFMEKIKLRKQEPENKHLEFCEKWLCSVSQFAFNNVEDFIVDLYASHILRTCLQCVSGVQVDINIMKSHRSRRHLDVTKSEADKAVSYRPKAFLEILEEFSVRFLSWPQLPDFVQSDNSSAVIQTFLYCVSQSLPKICEKLVRLLVHDIFPSFETIFEYPSVTHLLEVCLIVADDDTFKYIHQKYFSGKLKTLAENVDTKYAVVRLLENVKDKTLFAEVFEELAPALEDIFASGCGAVVSALATACQRLVTLQGKFLQHLMQAFHCYEPESRQMQIVPLVSRLVTYEVATSGDSSDRPNFPVHFLGSQIVQTLLHFNKPIKIINSMMEMDVGQLKDLLCDPCGSHITDAFGASEFVGEKSREKLTQKLQGVYYTLATSKHGSRSLDAIWQWSDLKWRLSIGEELLQKEAALVANPFGRILCDKYALPLLKKQKSDWKTSQEKESKKRKLFAELVPAEDQDAPSKKKTKRSKKKKSASEPDAE